MSLRTERAKQMIESGIFSSQYDRNTFRVQSQTDPDTVYSITKDGDRLVCTCPDHRTRKSDCKHIHVILENLRKNRCYADEEFPMIERTDVKTCKFCDSGNITKKGFRNNKAGRAQKFKCLDCNRGFTGNIGYEHRQFDHRTITQAIQMYYQGMSVRDISSNFEMLGTQISHKTIYNWVSEYSGMVSQYMHEIVPRTGNRPFVRADEVWIKVAGEQKYLFASMDDETRYWLAYEMAHTKFQHDADRLLNLTKTRIGRSPAHFATDGLPTYETSSRRIFGKDTNHYRHIHLAGKRDRDNNNKMERLNGEIRDREKVFRGLKKFDTRIIPGMWVYNNCTKKHLALDGRTPADAALIAIRGTNKWHTLIQNASLHRRSK